MKISVIIPSRQGMPQALIDSLSAQTLKPDEVIEVIGSALTVQRNEGVSAAMGDILIFIDDDIALPPNFIKEITYPLALFPGVSAVSGNPQVEIYKTNPLYELYAQLFMLTYRGAGEYQLSGFPTNYHPGNANIVISEMLHGCCMAIRREVFAKYSFNENLSSRMYGEDDYFANEIIKDFNICYNPTAICYDTRPYPKGRQAIKIRSTIYNLIARHKMKERSTLEKLCFVWAMVGFINLKIIEAVVMRDTSILKGLLLCLSKHTDTPLADVRRAVKIRRVNV
jgi:glycosyltransferase involved in cell wall biosynthesis